MPRRQVSGHQPPRGGFLQLTPPSLPSSHRSPGSAPPPGPKESQPTATAAPRPQRLPPRPARAHVIPFPAHRLPRDLRPSPVVPARGLDPGRSRHCSAGGRQRSLALAPRRRLAAATGDTPSRRPPSSWRRPSEADKGELGAPSTPGGGSGRSRLRREGRPRCARPETVGPAPPSFP